MNRQSILLGTALLTLMLSGCSPESSEIDNSAPVGEADKGYIVLDESLTRLIHDFNANRDKVRLLFIVGDTCGICLRGMADMNDAFLARAQADDRLLTLVVHVPTLGAQEMHVPEAIPLLQGPRIIHYWDGTGISGGKLMETLETGRAYAWDVWLAYGANAEWTGEEPPKPRFWMHQLPQLDPDLRLDAEQFGTKTLSLMQEVSGSELAERQASKSELLADGAVISSVAQPKGVAISSHIQGRGGYRRLKSIQSIQRQGKISSEAGTTAIRVVQDRSDGLLREYGDPAMGLPAELEAGLVESWEFDGQLVEWKDKGHQVRMSGMQKIGRSLAWKLFVNQLNGKRWAFYIDSHTGDLVLQERLDDSGTVVFSVVARDFEEIDGFRLPNTIEYRDPAGAPIATEQFTETRIEL